MQLTLKPATGDGPALTIDVDPEMTFADLSQHVAREWGWRPDETRLFDSIRPLLGSATPITAALPDGATLLVAPLDDAVRPPRDLDDPALPDYVRNPVERSPLPEFMVTKLTEMGLPLRVLRNAIRLALGANAEGEAAIGQAIEEQSNLITEADNAIVERAFLENSGADRAKADADLHDWRSRKSELNAIIQGPLFEKVTPPPWGEPGEELPDFTDLLQADVIERSRLLALVRDRMPGVGIQDGADIVLGLEKLRAVLMGGAAPNPFRQLQGIAKRALARDEFTFCAELGPKECRFVIEKLKEGTIVEEICEALRNAGGNIEDAEAILAA